MKSKFSAGLVATLVSLMVVTGIAVGLVSFMGPSADRLVKIAAFAVIAVWLGLYGWLKPKQPKANTDTNTPLQNSSSEKNSSDEPRRERNSYQ